MIGGSVVLYGAVYRPPRSASNREIPQRAKEKAGEPPNRGFTPNTPEADISRAELRCEEARI